jgi:hypothetical protein
VPVWQGELKKQKGKQNEQQRAKAKSFETRKSESHFCARSRELSMWMATSDGHESASKIICTHFLRSSSAFSLCTP